MQTLLVTGSGFKPDVSSSHLLAGRVDHDAEALAAATAPQRGGHVDEAIAVLADPAGERWPAEFPDEVLAEIYADQAISAADGSHRNELAALRTDALAAVGAAASVTASRSVSCDRAGCRPSYSVIIVSGDIVACGTGDTGPDALAATLLDLDRKRGIAPSFGGFTVPGVASVLAWPHRSKADALALARRIAIEPAYLSLALQHALPDVLDLRPVDAVA